MIPRALQVLSETQP